MKNQIEKNIVATIAYYDAFDYPLTAFEVWKYYIDAEYYEEKNKTEVTLEEVVKCLSQLTRPLLSAKTVDSYRGFYFLFGRKSLVVKRINRTKLSIVKIKRLRRVISWLRLIPFVRMVGLTGRLSMKNAWLGSDWDVLIVIKAGRIWIGRTLVTFFTQLIGKRRHQEKIRNRVCLNYFLADNSLEIKTKDLFSANEYYFMVPFFDSGNYYHSFQIKNNWIKKFKPNFLLNEINNLNLIEDNIWTKTLRFVFEHVTDFDWLEKKLCAWERAKIKRNPKTHKIGSMIEATHEALIFLPEPKGPKIFDKFKKNLSKIKF